MKTTLLSYKLLTVFRLYKTRNFVLVEPGGNFGDRIIYQGARKLARMAGISYKTTSFIDFMKTVYPPDVVIYIHGSGGFNQFWSGTPIKALQKALTGHRGTVILGPSTFQIDENFLDRFATDIFSRIVSEDVFLFFREKNSFESVKAKAPAEVNLFVDHDTALNLTKEDMPLAHSRPTDILYCIRSDKEMNPVQTYSFLSKWVDPIKCSRNFEEWHALHAGARHIITNRLHSAILGVILEIPVTLLPNSYHKNRAVWEFSLRQKYVEWANQIYVDRLNTQLDHIHALKRIRHSKLYQRMIRCILT